MLQNKVCLVVFVLMLLWFKGFTTENNEPSRFLSETKRQNLLFPMIDVLGKYRGRQFDGFSILTDVVKQSLSGIRRVIHHTCMSFLHGIVKTKVNPVEVDNFSFILVLKNESEHFGLDNLGRLVNSLEYDKAKKLTMFIPAWISTNGTTDSSETKSLINAYKKRKDANLVIFDVNRPLENIASWGTYPVQKVGTLLGEKLSELKYHGVKGDKIHLIGASVGAHIAGMAGITYRLETNGGINRITGLDPASICFNSDVDTHSLSSSSADFVDVIHTSSGFGNVESLGHVDFYVNQMSVNQPGCHDTMCSHLRAVEYFAESAVPDQEENFKATECSSRTQFILGFCRRRQRSFMGLVTPTSTRGKYYLNTNSNSPFGYEHSSMKKGVTEPTESFSESATRVSTFLRPEPGPDALI